MCERCVKYGYKVVWPVLTKRVNYSSGHLHHWTGRHGWAIDKLLFDTHVQQLDSINIYAIDQDIHYTISIADFLKYRLEKIDDRDGGIQYFVEDKYWAEFGAGKKETVELKPKAAPAQERLF